MDPILRTLIALAACVLPVKPQPPAIYWASDPVRPGEAVLITGSGLGAETSVQLFRLPDGPPGNGREPVAWPSQVVRPEVLQPRGQSLKFLVPPGSVPGVFALRAVSGQTSSKAVLINAPQPWWCQGDLGTRASPGGKVRVFGKNLGWPPDAERRDNPRDRPQSSVTLRSQQTLLLPAKADCYGLEFAVPGDLQPGTYELRVHNGCGGPHAWSEPLALEVARPAPWPSLTLNVMDFGAEGRGREDDTAAIGAALAKLRSAGGGVLYFPRGRYLVSKTLSIPERTVLRGEKRELSSIAWPDSREPLPDLLVGTHSFAIEELSLFSANYGNFLTVDLKSPAAGNIRLHRLRIVANRFRGHLYNDPEEMSRRFTRFGVHGGKLLALGGENVEVSDCDLLSSGCALYLTRARGARIAGNTLRMGRFGWFWLSGSDGVVFENNQCLGQDLSTWGGGINCLDGSTFSQHVYFAGNTLSCWFGGDNELTSDGSGGAYYGKAASAGGTTLTTADDPKWDNRDWRGSAVIIIGGTGVGQYRRIVKGEGRRIEVDRPWDVPPDATSQLTVTMYQGDYLLLNNRATDIGVVQFYGTSLNHVCAGNVSTRTAGLFNVGMNYYGIQPSWYVQWLDNVIDEGNGYDSAHLRLPRDAALGLLGSPPAPDFPYAINLGSIARRNRLLSNASIQVGRTETVPTVQDAVVENNLVEDNDCGIEIAPGAAGVLVRENKFARVSRPILDRGQVAREVAARRDKLAGQREPLAAWDFANASGVLVRDSGPNRLPARVRGALAILQEGPGGACARFDGATYLQVGASDSEEQELFNQPSFTLSLWLKPDGVQGRQGLLVKRFAHTGPPFVLSIFNGSILFEGADRASQWSHNFQSPAVVVAGGWQHVAAVVEEGKGVRLYHNGRMVAEKATREKLLYNSEPLVIGREAWSGPGGSPGPTFYRGLLGPIRIWARPLSADEVTAQARK
jgi:hypothetical protein